MLDFSKLKFHHGFNSLSVNQFTIYSCFQKIYQLPNQNCIGYEALLRATDLSGNAVSPESILSDSGSTRQRVQNELKIAVLHLSNFIFYCDKSERSLFINLSPDAISYLGSCEPLLVAIVKYTDRIANSRKFLMSELNLIIEITEEASSNRSNFSEALTRLQQLGFVFAVDDFGSGCSDLERVVATSPLIVKLDRTLVWNLASSNSDELTQLINVLKKRGIKILAEGIETLDNFHIAKNLGVDMVQGYYMNKPVILGPR